jgi:TPR repeat protein
VDSRNLKDQVIVFIVAIAVVVAAAIGYRVIYPRLMDYRQYRMLSGLARQGDTGYERLLAEYLWDKGEKEEALKWELKSAEGGDPLAQNFMGFYYDGSLRDPSPTQVDYTTAREWYEKAAAQDFPTSQFELCKMYHLGQGVEQDQETAYFWCSLSERFDEAVKLKQISGATLDEEALHRVELRLTAWKESHRMGH